MAFGSRRRGPTFEDESSLIYTSGTTGRLAMQALIAPFLFTLVVGAQPVVPPIAPPKPAVPRAPNAIVISTGDLNSSVNWARQGRLGDATTSFNLFKDDWNVVVDDVRQQSGDIAD